jgi:hypothetical protein
VKHERTDTFKFKDKTDFYEPNKNITYLENNYEREMKKLYGATPLKYLGDRRPVLGLETGNVGLYAPLHQTRYKSVDGWNKNYMRHRGTAEDKHRLTVKTFNKEDG